MHRVYHAHPLLSIAQNSYRLVDSVELIVFFLDLGILSIELVTKNKVDITLGGLVYLRR